MIVERHLSKAVEEATADTPVIFLRGPRQVGKSTLGQAAIQKLGGQSVTLDDILAQQLALSNPGGFLKAWPSPVLIDEVQRAPGLLQAIKQQVDHDRQPGSYLLTGSSNVLASPKVSESLAGRMEILDLYPFSQGELHGEPDGFINAAFSESPEWKAENLPTSELSARIVRGGFPEPALRASARRRAPWYENYVRTLLERDVRDLANIQAIGQLPQVFALLASRVGQPMNANSLAAETGIPYTSLKRYLSLLEAIFLLQPVPAWSMTTQVPLAKSPKPYLVDTGLLCHLLNLQEDTLPKDPTRFGPIVENFVAMELRKQCAYSDLRPRLLHLRSARQWEVDFVLQGRGDRLVGVDVVVSDTVVTSHLGGLRHFRQLAGDRFLRGIVLYLGDEIRRLEDDLWAIPLSALWKTG